MLIQQAQAAIVQMYGELGFETAKKMEKILRPYSMSVAFHKETKKFIVYNSSQYDRGNMQMIFSNHVFTGLKPYIEPKTNSSNYHQIVLKPLNYMHSNL